MRKAPATVAVFPNRRQRASSKGKTKIDLPFGRNAPERHVNVMAPTWVEVVEQNRMGEYGGERKRPREQGRG